MQFNFVKIVTVLFCTNNFDFGIMKNKYLLISVSQLNLRLNAKRNSYLVAMGDLTYFGWVVLESDDRIDNQIKVSKRSQVQNDKKIKVPKESDVPTDKKIKISKKLDD